MALSEAAHRARGGGARRSRGARHRFLPRLQRGRAAPDDFRNHPGQGTFDRRARRPHAVHRCRQPAGAAQGRFVRAAVGRQPQSCWNWCASAGNRSNGFASAGPATGSGNGVAALIPADAVRAAGFDRGRAAELSGPDADRRRRGDRRDGRAPKPAGSRRQHRHRSVVQPLRDPGDHIGLAGRSCRQPGRSARIGHRRQRASGDRHSCAFGPAAEASARQSDRRDRARAQGRRVRAVLPADRRHPLGPAARRGGADPLAQTRRHHRAARVVHSAGRVRAASSSN